MAAPASRKRPRRNKNGGGKTTKTTTGESKAEAKAKAKAKTVVKVAKRGKGKAAVDGAAVCAAAAKAGRSAISREKQAHAQVVVTNNSKPVEQRKKRGPYKKRKRQQPTPTAAGKKIPADTTASSRKAPRKSKNDDENADADDDASSSSSSSSSTDEARTCSARSIGEISVQSNTRAKRTSTGSASKSLSFAPAQTMPVIDDAEKVTVGGASSSSALPPQSPIALGSPTRLSISKLQSPLRSPGLLRLPASTAAAAAATVSTGRSVGTGPSPGKQPKRHRPGCIPQFLGEDILCDTGLAFLPPDYDDPDEDETLDHWRAKYENGPGVSRSQITSSASKAVTGRSRQYARRGSSGSVGSSGSAGGSGGTSGSITAGGSSSDHQRYKSVVRYNGAPINLGTHRTSAAAVAMQDLADLALLGSEHDKKMQLLSRDEAWKALHTAKLPGVHPYGQVDQFSELFSAEYKPIFEEKMEDALASIGGQDDMLAEVLCRLDNETHRQAEAADTSAADQLNRVRKYKEKNVTRRARRTEKLLKKHLAVKPRRTGPVNAPRFQQDHGIYGVGDDGKIFWFRIKDHAEVRQREMIMREHRSNNTGVANDDGEKSMNLVESSDNAAPNLGDSQHDTAIAAPADGADASDDHDKDSDHEEADDEDGSVVSSSSSGDSSSVASSISSAGSGDRSGKVRILPFDDDEAISANKQQNLKVRNRETRAPGIPDAITITSTNVILPAEEKEETTAASGTIEPVELADPENNEVNEMKLNLPPQRS